MALPPHAVCIALVAAQPLRPWRVSLRVGCDWLYRSTYAWNGSGLIVLAVVTLGDSWRIGQDQSDATCAYVTQGPYRFLHHPIYWGMMISAFGQMLLTDGDARGLTLLAGTLTYVLLQGRAESLRWAPAKLLCKPGAAAADVATSRYLNPSNLPKKVQ
jgi:protein-S-isoprenylcysteine O-methyltransferase Ste14